MQTQPAVNPGDDQRDGLQCRVSAAIRPKREQDVQVAILGPMESLVDPRREHMIGQQRPGDETQQQLGRLQGTYLAQPPMLVQRPQSQEVVDRQRTIKQRRRGQTAPHRQEPASPSLHGLQRPQTERVIRQVGKHVGKQDKAGDQAQPSQLLAQLRAPPRGDSSGNDGHASPRHRCDPTPTPPRAIGEYSGRHGSKDIGRPLAGRVWRPVIARNSKRGGPRPPLPKCAELFVSVSSPGTPPAGRTCGPCRRPRDSRCRTGPPRSSRRWFRRRSSRPA